MNLKASNAKHLPFEGMYKPAKLQPSFIVEVGQSAFHKEDSGIAPVLGVSFRSREPTNGTEKVDVIGPSDAHIQEENVLDAETETRSANIT